MDSWEDDTVEGEMNMTKWGDVQETSWDFEELEDDISHQSVKVENECGHSGGNSNRQQL